MTYNAHNDYKMFTSRIELLRRMEILDKEVGFLKHESDTKLKHLASKNQDQVNISLRTENSILREEIRKYIEIKENNGKNVFDYLNIKEGTKTSEFPTLLSYGDNSEMCTTFGKKKQEAVLNFDHKLQENGNKLMGIDRNLSNIWK